MSTRKIKQYKFEDSVNGLKATIYINLILAFMLSMPDFANVFSNIHIIACISTFGLFYIVSKNYNWSSQTFNIVMLVAYLGILGIEYSMEGLPAYLLGYDFNNFQLSKGIMFDLLIMSLPSIYIGLRIACIIPILFLIRNRSMLNSYEN